MPDPTHTALSRTLIPPTPKSGNSIDPEMHLPRMRTATRAPIGKIQRDAHKSASPRALTTDLHSFSFALLSRVYGMLTSIESRSKLRMRVSPDFSIPVVVTARLTEAHWEETRVTSRGVRFVILGASERTTVIPKRERVPDPLDGEEKRGGGDHTATLRSRVGAEWRRVGGGCDSLLVECAWWWGGELRREERTPRSMGERVTTGRLAAQ